ncbi:hypothetical protein TRICI_004588 [Trichomonascus ciferrii]|uniref:Uncharacterized protein n=1 Tax=Trichomonascus ciferrii TaxID=44093 RepID=A0A642V0B6_9ASCO|nr:hypothetical protein TRICI_004588 [Trichomonascus ciferrii]
MSINRLRLVQQKETAIAKQQRRSLLLARIGLLDQRECDPGLEEAVKTIIYTAPRTEIKELQQVRDALIHKFSKEFAKDAIENESNVVPDKVMKRLSSAPPSNELVSLYLKEIARAYSVPFSELSDNDNEDESRDDNDEDDNPSGGEKEKERRLSNLPSPETAPKSPIAVMAPNPTTDNPSPSVKLDSNTSAKVNSEISKAKQSNSKAKKDEQELDALRKRFEALRK